MCYWLIPESGIPISETTVQHVTKDDLAIPEVEAKVTSFNKAMDECLDDTNFILPLMDELAIEDVDLKDPAYTETVQILQPMMSTGTWR